jgi:hypothetical protein
MGGENLKEAPTNSEFIERLLSDVRILTIQRDDAVRAVLLERDKSKALLADAHARIAGLEARLSAERHRSLDEVEEQAGLERTVRNLTAARDRLAAEVGALRDLLSEAQDEIVYAGDRDLRERINAALGCESRAHAQHQAALRAGQMGGEK